MLVREARLEDASAIAGVSVTTWRSAYAHIVPKAYLDSLSVGSRAQRVLKAMEGGERYWVAELASSVIGFVTVGKNREVDCPADAELKAIYVAPNVSRKGIGGKMLIPAVDFLIEEGYKTMVVFAFRDNDIARGFYIRLGAVPYGESTFTLDGVAYPDSSYYWASLQALRERLGE